MKEETETPETLVAIIAEIRKSANDSYAEKTAKRLEDHEATGTRDALDIKDAIQCLRDDDKYLLGLADRIEEAAKRERAITDVMLAVKDKPLPHPDPEHAPPLYPGNAAAMREAIVNVASFAANAIDYDGPERDVDAYRWLGRIAQTASAALAAPARNVDRFATEDEAREAYWAYREPLEFNDKPFVAITEWLFAPAEGGDHA